MSDMKCPVCNKGTVKEFETAPCFVCSNGFCPSYSETDTTEYDILIRTRKALEIAWDGLEKIGSGDVIEHSVVGHEDDNKIFIANKALNESKTALEQKE